MNRTISKLALYAIAFITILAYFVSYYGWQIYLELLSHFQVQYFVGSLVLLFILFLLRQKNHIYWGLFFCALLSVQVLPWFWLPNNLSIAASQQSNLRLFVANLSADNQNYDKVLNLIKAEQPDIAIFLEANKQWQTQLDTLGDILPYSAQRCKSKSCNMGILIYTNQLLNSSKIESFGADDNSNVIAQLTVADKPLTLVATHPFPPIDPKLFQSRNRQLDLIAQYLSTADGRTIVAGDFNITMWSPYYRKFIAQTGLTNVRRGLGILPTWPIGKTRRSPDWVPQWIVTLFRIPIDQCLIGDGVNVTSIHTASETGSDHLPLVVDLLITD